MGKEPVPNIPAVTRFVREVIGCNCPEEVFRDIEVQRDSSALNACSADCELRIGGRWYQIESKPEWPRAHYFRVHAANAREYLLKHDLETDEWFLRHKLTKPSKCPECHSTWLMEPKIGVENKIGAGKSPSR